MKKKKKNYTYIGGQAVMEGVMMRGKTSECISVRDSDGIIRSETKRLKPLKERNVFFRIPIIRGILNFFMSLIDGTRVLMRSASVYGEDEPSKFEKFLSEKLKINLMGVITTVSMIVGLGLAILLFVLCPQLATNLFAKWFKFSKTSFVYNLIEGLLRITIFVIYIVIISLIKDIKRVFMYHGAEHKTISCYENGLELTVENVKKCSRVHNRCGTTFLFYVMFVSILVFSLANSVFKVEGFLRILLKIALLPLVAGISYELLKLLAKTENPVFLILKAPGLLLQRLTTKEPDGEMIEVAINSFNTVLLMDNDQSVPTKDFITAKKVKDLYKEQSEIFKSSGVDVCDLEWIISDKANVKRSEIAQSDTVLRPMQVEKILKDVTERLSGKPLQYVLGTADFYGCIFNVDERVLIPRCETEELVEKALKLIKKEDKVLDLCTGSGAIAVTVKKKSGCQVFASDVDERALELAKQNAYSNQAEINFICSDMFENITEQFNVIISNPPYIKTEDIKSLDKEIAYEPYIALDGGQDGLNFYRIISDNAKNFLADDGMIFLEIGYNQAEDIKEIFSSYSKVEIIKDLSGNDRIAVVNK
ncbi:MAG TPA: peptide chain release factor N(5)-glutamine methyltransferase [Clostridiales bacterium]|nr:peptide chain release factor N(5)-glutamine methyltransferase [Clostridiales bacterium]HBJ98240.1 peptide chain release factor N(5)-glutamine methyltransferase [Clostridiales bacterium]